MKNPQLMQVLKGRGLSVTKLARAIGTDHRQVSLTLSNTPGRGYRTRPKLAALLTRLELEMLGWNGDGTRVDGSNGNHGKNGAVVNNMEQSST